MALIAVPLLTTVGPVLPDKALIHAGPTHSRETVRLRELRFKAARAA